MADAQEQSKPAAGAAEAAGGPAWEGFGLVGSLIWRRPALSSEIPP